MTPKLSSTPFSRQNRPDPDYVQSTHNELITIDLFGDWKINHQPKSSYESLKSTYFSRNQIKYYYLFALENFFRENIQIFSPQLRTAKS